MWSRKDLLRFFEAFQKFGRTDIEEITKFIDTKTSLEVRNYSSVFWRRFKELEDVSLKKIAEETLDLDMVKKLQRFLLDKGSEAIPEHNKENDDDCRLIAVLKEFDLEDVKDVMSDILDKLKSFNTGKSAEDVRSKCQQLMKTHELLLEFTNLGLPEITFVKVEPLKQSAEELEKRAELLKIKRAKKAEKDANSPRKIARAAEKVEKAKLALGAKLSKENASKSPKKLAKEKASKSPKKLAKEKASKAAAKSKSPKKPAKTLKNAKSPKKDVKTKKRQDVETSRSSKKRKQEFWDADAAEPKKCRIEVKRLSNELLKEVDLTEVAPENVKWPKTRKTKKEK